MNYLSNLAANHLDKALSIDPKHQKSIALLCDIYASNSEHSKALELLKAYKRNDYLYNFLSANLEYKLGNYKKAANFITTCINERECTLDSFVLAKNIFLKNNDLLRYKICLEKLVAYNTDKYSYYIELASCYNHTDEHENAMALLETALDLTPNKDVVLLSVLKRILNKYIIHDDGIITRDIDVDRLEFYYITFSNYEVRDTERLSLVKKFYKANLNELAFMEVNKVKMKTVNLYHHIHGINLFSSNRYNESLKRLNKVSRNYDNFHFVASLLGQILLKKNESKKAKKFLLHAIKLIKEAINIKNQQIEDHVNLNSFDKVYQLTIESNELMMELDRCNKFISLSS